MKTLKKLLGTYKLISSSAILGGLTLMGLGAYNLSRDKINDGDVKIFLGQMITMMGIGYYLGNLKGEKLNKKNYQTKIENYQ